MKIISLFIITFMLADFAFAQDKKEVCAREIPTQLDLFVEMTDGDVEGVNDNIFVVTDNRSRKKTAIRLKDSMLREVGRIACKAICNKSTHKACGYVAACVDGILSEATQGVPVCIGLWLFSEESLVESCRC